MKKYCRIVLLLFFIAFSKYVSAQEVLIGLPYNSLLKKFYKDHPQKLNKNINNLQDTVSLPFFDDFSKPAIYPDSNLWGDNNAFVNTGYNSYSGNELLDTTRSHNPPTIGIATLDAIDAHGNIYNHLQPGIASVADTLTSKPINLNFLPGDSVYLSFQYQPTSNNIGNAPETNDSLLLEFYSPVDSSWYNIWYTLGSADKTYRKVMLPITDTFFLKKGFKFRFKNYVTLGSNYEPSWLSNCDQWNLDFILLDKNRHYNDTFFEEIAMLYPIKSILKNSLESMPWKHFKAAGSSMISTTLTMIFRNIGKTINPSVNHIARIKDLSGVMPPYQTYNAIENASPDKIHFWPVTFTYPFYTTAIDSAEFEIKCYIDPALPTPYLSNDTTYYHQKFYNYYAYDDGTAEAGYGLSGEGAMNSKMAVKYKCYKKDTLRGVDIFFNNTMDNYTGSKYFYLNVWNDAGGHPGDTIRCQMGQKPHFDGLNEFHMYIFDNPVIIDSGTTFYVGEMQTTNDMLNIGFDRNRDTHENIYYSISGTWVQSAYSGTLMIRPLFGSPLPKSSSSENNLLINASFEIYPNPASDKLNITYPDDFSIEKSKVTISDIYGKTLYVNLFSNTIDVAYLSPGIYFLTIIDFDKYSQTKKFIISR